jgi:hypothetical protein
MSNFPEFQEFKKIPRLSRDIVITEKIDGTNGVIYIDENNNIFAGSRNRWLWGSIQEEIHNDNHGFAGWVKANKEELLKLGQGFHYGEWWGSGMQRGYDLPKGEKRFSLFNTKRWVDKRIYPDFALEINQEFCPDCCYVVPILYKGVFDMEQIELELLGLNAEGSKASPGFMKPEGIVIYHTAGNLYFKKTIENDDKAKGEK